MSNTPEHFLCPITYSIMIEPVLAKDGYTYEESAIVPWILHKHSKKALDFSPGMNLNYNGTL